MAEDNLIQTLTELRKLFDQLTPAQQQAEATRLYCKTKGLPIYYLEPLDRPEVLQFSTIQDVMAYLEKKGYRPNKSNINKVLKGERKQAYGHRIYAVKGE